MRHWVQFETWNGGVQFIDRSRVESVETSVAGRDGHSTLVMISGAKHDVKGTPHEIMEKIATFDGYREAAQ